MMTNAIVKLRKPVKASGQEISISQLGGIPMAAVEQISAPDFMAAQTAILRFFVPREEEAPDAA